MNELGRLLGDIRTNEFVGVATQPETMEWL
jgi:hypothetical protein